MVNEDQRVDCFVLLTSHSMVDTRLRRGLTDLALAEHLSEDDEGPIETMVSLPKPASYFFEVKGSNYSLKC